jgi:hypothetical protein
LEEKTLGATGVDRQKSETEEEENFGLEGLRGSEQF